MPPSSSCGKNATTNPPSSVTAPTSSSSSYGGHLPALHSNFHRNEVPSPLTLLPSSQHNHASKAGGDDGGDGNGEIDGDDNGNDEKEDNRRDNKRPRLSSVDTSVMQQHLNNASVVFPWKHLHDQHNHALLGISFTRFPTCVNGYGYGYGYGYGCSNYLNGNNFPLGFNNLYGCGAPVLLPHPYQSQSGSSELFETQQREREATDAKRLLEAERLVGVEEAERPGHDVLETLVATRLTNEEQIKAAREKLAKKRAAEAEKKRAAEAKRLEKKRAAEAKRLEKKRAAEAKRLEKKRVAESARLAKEKAEEEEKGWLREQKEKCEYLMQNINELDDGEEMKQTLTELVETMGQHLGDFGERTVEQKKCITEGATECVELVTDLLARIDKGENIPQQTMSAVEDEFSKLEGIINEESSTKLRDYQTKLKRRKKYRGRGSEAQRRIWKVLDVKKKEFMEKKSLWHLSPRDEFPEDLASELEELLRDVGLNKGATTAGKMGRIAGEQAAEIALQCTKVALDRAAGYCGLKRKEEFIPPSAGDSVDNFLKMDREVAMNGLYQEALEKTKELSDELKSNAKDHDSELLAHGIVNSTANILNFYDDINDSLCDGKVRAIRNPSNEESMLFTRVPNELVEEACIGRNVSDNRALETYVRHAHTKGNYVLEVFSIRDYPRLYKVTEDSIERIHFHVNTKDNLFTIACAMARDKTFESEMEYNSDSRQWSLHQLHAAVLDNLGYGLNNRKWFRDHHGLKDGETFEAKVSYYDYYPEPLKQQKKRLDAKEWREVKQALRCDQDHLLGRLCAWMNTSLFTMSCSHSWNQCMMKVRQRMGCWGFGFANIKYNGGN